MIGVLGEFCERGGLGVLVGGLDDDLREPRERDDAADIHGVKGLVDNWPPSSSHSSQPSPSVALPFPLSGLGLGVDFVSSSI